MTGPSLIFLILENSLREYLFNSSMNTYLTMTCDLFEVCQSVYRECHITEAALLNIVSDIPIAMDARQCVLLVLLNYSI